jgi:hypothetical protein
MPASGRCSAPTPIPGSPSASAPAVLPARVASRSPPAIRRSRRESP